MINFINILIVIFTYQYFCHAINRSSSVPRIWLEVWFVFTNTKLLLTFPRKKTKLWKQLYLPNYSRQGTNDTLELLK